MIRCCRLASESWSRRDLQAGGHEEQSNDRELHGGKVVEGRIEKTVAAVEDGLINGRGGAARVKIGRSMKRDCSALCPVSPR